MLTHLSPVEGKHVVHVANTIRQADADEIEAMAGLDPLTGLTESVAASHVAYSMMAGDEPVAIYGARRLTADGIGMVWLLASTEVMKHTTSFLKKSIEYTNRLHQEVGCHTLANYTDARNTVHHKWLRFTGFTFGKQTLIRGHAFLEISRTRGSTPCAD